MYLIKKEGEGWPEKLTYAALRRGMKDCRFKLCHDGDAANTAAVLAWLKTKGLPLVQLCHSATPQVFAAITNGPCSPEVLDTLQPDYSDPESE